MDANEILNQVVDSAKAAGAELAKTSKALGDAAVTTGQITFRAGQDLLRGAIDLEGAQRVSQRGFEQLKTLAVAQGNATAAATADWLKSLADLVLAFVGNLRIKT